MKTGKNTHTHKALSCKMGPKTKAEKQKRKSPEKQEKPPRIHTYYIVYVSTLKYLALGQSVVNFLDGHVGASEVHVRDKAVLVLRAKGQLEGEVRRAAPRAPGKVDEKRLRGLHAAHPVHQVLHPLCVARRHNRETAKQKVGSLQYATLRKELNFKKLKVRK